MPATEPQRRRHITGAKTPTLTSVAEMIFDRCGRDSNKAIKELAAKIYAKPTLETATIAATAIIGGIMAADRAKVFSGQTANTNIPGTSIPHENMPSYQSDAGKAASAQRLRNATINGLFGAVFKHDGQDVTLGLATPEQLRPIAARYIETGATSVRRGRWLERICAEASPGIAVSMSLTLKRVEQMKAEADKIAV